MIVYQMGLSRDPPGKITIIVQGVGHSRLARIVVEEFRARPGQRR